jgi:hypothetical protein
MNFRRAALAGTLALFSVFGAAVAAAGADQTYTVDGRDVYRVGGGETQSRTLYHGTEQLTIERRGGRRIYVAHASYDKSGENGKERGHASFTSTLLPSGEQRDGPSNDPDYLTVLNQPFSVQLTSSAPCRSTSRRR